MAVRIFKLAKELEMSSKDLMTYLRTQGHKVTNHMCTVDDHVAQILRDRLPRKSPAKKAAETKAEEKAKATEPAQASSGNGKAETRPRAEKAAASRTESAPAAADSTRTGTTRKGRSGASTGDAAPTEDGRPKKPAKRRFFPGASDYASYGGPGKAGGRGVRRPHRKPGGRGGDATPGGAAAAMAPTVATVQLPITIKDLSSVVGVRVNRIMTTLFKKGIVVNVNSYAEEDLLKEIGEEFNVAITIQKEKRLEDAIKEIESFESTEERLEARAPVVTFLGHVDHGKTSLLDYIRQSKVTAREHGGITQHLGAYRVDEGKIQVVFIDTPGHKAFTEMRARGANVTDVAVLVVAADEGPMPQTEEAYNHAVAADVPIVVALNKIDRPNANSTRVKEQLSNLGLQPVEWGGKTECVEVSAQTGQGIDDLLEVLSLESEILALKANPTRPAVGVVLEAELNPGRGNLATVLVQDGTLRIGDTVLCGSAHGRIRNMWLNGTTAVEEAGPSNPVQISGLARLPEVGDKFYVFEDPAKAREISVERTRKRREEDRASVQKVSLQNFLEHFEQSEVKELNLVLKADVKGSLEAIKQALDTVGNEEVKVRILHSAVGAVSQDDVLLADASSGIILGFNVNVDDRAKVFADEKQIEIRTYNVIYELLDDVKLALEARLAPELREEFEGRLEILQIFRASKIGKIAGCMVRKGKIQRDSKVRVIRNDEVLHTGVLSSLKRFKEDTKEVREGFECGIKVSGYDDIQEGDFVESFRIVEEKRTL